MAYVPLLYLFTEYDFKWNNTSSGRTDYPIDSRALAY